jgi:hypothetical protein
VSEIDAAWICNIWDTECRTDARERADKTTLAALEVPLCHGCPPGLNFNMAAPLTGTAFAT